MRLRPDQPHAGHPYAVLLALAGLAASLLVVAGPAQATPTRGAPAQAAPGRSASQGVAAPSGRPAVVKRVVIGRSVRGRPIRAWRLGEPGTRRVLLVSTMHGNERATRAILDALRDGRTLRGIDLWVIPNYNPDGAARGTRKNARGVDLNRNFPFNWADLDGPYESGPRPASEPETRAMMGFLKRIRPARILSFHQPLYGVDTDTKDPRFARRVARHLRLPAKSFTCGGVCHGTMTGWFNRHFSGSALTVEYGARPARRHLARTVPRQLLALFDARRVRRG